MSESLVYFKRIDDLVFFVLNVELWSKSYKNVTRDWSDLTRTFYTYSCTIFVGEKKFLKFTFFNNLAVRVSKKETALDIRSAYSLHRLLRSQRLDDRWAHLLDEGRGRLGQFQRHGGLLFKNKRGLGSLSGWKQRKSEWFFFTLTLNLKKMNFNVFFESTPQKLPHLEVMKFKIIDSYNHAVIAVMGLLADIPIKLSRAINDYLHPCEPIIEEDEEEEIEFKFCD